MTLDNLNSKRISRSRVSITALAFLVTLSSPVIAQVTAASTATTQPGAVALSLDDALQRAESQSEAVQIARAGVMRTRGQVMQARSQYLPQLYGSAGYTRTLKSQYQGFGGSATATDTTKPAAPKPPCNDYLADASAPVTERVAGLEQAAKCLDGINPFASFSSLPFGQANQYQLGLSVSQSVFSGGRVAAQNAAALAGQRSANIELAAQRAQIVLDVTQAYYDAALADRLVGIAEASYTQTENLFKQTQLAKDVGNTSEFELLRAQVTRDNQRPLVIQRRSDREVAYLRLKQLLNLPLEQPLTLTTSIDDAASSPPPIRLTGLSVSDPSTPDTAAANRATVRQASEAVRVQQSLVRVARAQRLPSLSLNSQYGKVGYPKSGLPTWDQLRTNWTIGVSTQLPLFTGGKIRGDELVAQANLAESRARLSQVRELASLDARVALNSLAQAQAAWEASRGTAEQATRAYTIAEVRYREGISTQLELNDSRILLEQATVNRALAARNLQIARVKLALLPNLPLGTGTSSQSAQSQQQQQQTQQYTQPTTPQQQQQQQGQPGTGTLASQQIPPGL
ncbi:MAG TPA: TolC family protein [Gemmatimonadaceae bacterium]